MACDYDEMKDEKLLNDADGSLEAYYGRDEPYFSTENENVTLQSDGKKLIARSRANLWGAVGIKLTVNVKVT